MKYQHVNHLAWLLTLYIGKIGKPKSHEAEVNLMNRKPLYDRVVIKRVEEENKTKGGIVIPDTAKEKSVRGQLSL